MKPRRVPLLVCLLCLLLTAGCNGPALRSQSPEDFAQAVESQVRLVGDIAQPYGASLLKVEAVALVTNLAGTGDDPPPSPQRSLLLRDLQSKGVDNPNQLLASPNTSMVLIRGLIPPGAQKGDKFDVEVQVPNGSETTSLRDGWLMETRMSEVAIVGNELHEGHNWATGRGPVLVDPSADGEKDRGLLVHGRVLGGGTVTRSRTLALIIAPEERHVRTASQIGTAINRRFHNFSHGIQKGMASPISDERIDLAVHPRYKDNLARYVRVVRAIALRESPSERIVRLKLLERQLLDPVTSATAALRLEAIGHEGIEVLRRGIEAADPEVRFYAAEALAYLDETNAAEPLGLAARDEPAFRAYALTALSAMDDAEAYDQLVTLLEVPSAETRYGAFRALWAMNPKNECIRGEKLGDQFSYHVLKTKQMPMIHVTRSFRPEIVLFGEEQKFDVPMVLEAGKSILVSGDSNGRVTVSKFAVGQADQKRVVSAKVDEVIRAVVELGGTYPDVVQALQQAKTGFFLTSRLEIDALPDNTRIYERKENDEHELAATRRSGKPRASELNTHAGVEVASPVPGLFAPAGKLFR